MSSSYRNSLNEWLANLDVKADRVLDIGGSQLTMPKRVKSWDVGKYLIADLPEPHEDSPKPDIEMDLNEDPTPPGYNDDYSCVVESHGESFDMIFCLEVFDYVYDPMSAFKTIYMLLKEGGTAWATFPSVYPLHQPIEDDALRYMPGGIKKLAAEANLIIEEMIPRRFETDAWDRTIRAERLRAAKHEDHNFSGWIVRFTK